VAIVASAEEDGMTIEEENRFLQGVAKGLAEENERLQAQRDALKAAVRAYVVAAMRAPNNRDEAEVDAASRGLVQALKEAE
jgi:phage shock protein PspC (stress-responsive transcriptional regulator)